ncbi:MAG: DoxX family protein [Neisseriaceae bacterium]|nr:DoxX family protein [Neisseriaceae bacterium]
MRSLIQRLLNNQIIYYFAQFALTAVFWQSGLSKLLNFGDTQLEMASHGLTPTWLFAALTVAIQIIGPLILIFGRRLVWLAAAGLIVFTIGTMMVAHPFWQLSDPVAHQAALAELYPHLTYIGGFLLSAIAAELKYNPSAWSRTYQ